MAFVPWPGFGPFESWDPEHTVAGGETLELAGLTFDVIFTPGHSPGHVTYAVRDEPALFSGDVLFQGSVGRIDLPGGDGPTLMRSIATLLERFDDDTVVYPGHMGITTLGRERATNPFLASSPRAVSEQPPGSARHVRRAAGGRGRARGARGDRPADPRAAPATGASRRRRSSTPSSSRAASASRRTSSRRRCTPSTTAAGAR